MKSHIALIDHGVGNLRSVEKALAAVGANCTKQGMTFVPAQSKTALGGLHRSDKQRFLEASGCRLGELAGHHPNQTLGHINIVAEGLVFWHCVLNSSWQATRVGFRASWILDPRRKRLFESKLQ